MDTSILFFSSVLFLGCVTVGLSQFNDDNNYDGDDDDGDRRPNDDVGRCYSCKTAPSSGYMNDYNFKSLYDELNYFLKLDETSECMDPFEDTYGVPRGVKKQSNCPYCKKGYIRDKNDGDKIVFTNRACVPKCDHKGLEAGNYKMEVDCCRTKYDSDKICNGSQGHHSHSRALNILLASVVVLLLSKHFV